MTTLLDEIRKKGTEKGDLVAFSLYLTVIVAVFTFLCSVLGLWASSSAHRSVVRAYYLVMLPLCMTFLIAVAIECFWTSAYRSNITGEGGLQQPMQIQVAPDEPLGPHLQAYSQTRMLPGSFIPMDCRIIVNGDRVRHDFATTSTPAALGLEDAERVAVAGEGQILPDQLLHH